MSRIDFTQPHLDIAVVECGDETENFTPIGDLPTILFELGIVLRYRFPKISKGTFEIVVGDKELFFSHRSALPCIRPRAPKSPTCG